MFRQWQRIMSLLLNKPHSSSQIKVYQVTKPQDIKKICHLVSAAQVEGVFQRTKAEYTQAAKNGLLFAAKHTNTKKIIATASCFKLDQQGNYFETGGCYVAPEFRGLSLQKALLTARIIKTIELYGLEATIATGIAPSNTVSGKNVFKLGFERYEKRAQIYFNDCKRCNCQLSEQQRCGYVYYRMPLAAKMELIESFAQTTCNPDWHFCQNIHDATRNIPILVLV